MVASFGVNLAKEPAMKCLAVFVVLAVSACAGSVPLPQPVDPAAVHPKIDRTPRCNLSWLDQMILAGGCGPLARH